MISTSHTPLAIITAAILATVGLVSKGVAQDAPPPPSPGEGFGKGPDDLRPGSRIGALRNVLSEDEMRQFGEALRKAKDDPRLAELREGMKQRHDSMRTAFREALLKADPSLQPILDKVEQARKGRGPGGPGRRFFERGPGRDGSPRNNPNLTDEQRAKLDAARENAAEDPAVVAAREKLKNAGDRDQKAAAARELRDAMKDAMRRVDPSIEPLLEQKDPAPKPEPAGAEI